MRLLCFKTMTGNKVYVRPDKVEGIVTSSNEESEANEVILLMGNVKYVLNEKPEYVLDQLQKEA